MQPLSVLDSDEAPESGAMPVVSVADGATKLSRAQRRFNKLIEKLIAQREELARWQAFKSAHEQRLAADYWPLAARIREKRRAIVRVLDRAMDSKVLVKRELAKVKTILVQVLSTLLEEKQDPELIELHDKYAELSFSEEQQQDLDLIRAVATEKYGIDLDEYEGGETPEELSAWLAAHIKASQSESPPPPKVKKNAEAVAEGGTRAVRDVFRKLVSELHPDRETDPAEHARKTELMQKVNQAYEAGDLLALLEVQLTIEQINPASLGNLADERLKHYIHVFEEQSRQLSDQIAEILAPFVSAVGGTRSGRVSADAVSRSLAADVRELKLVLRSVEHDFTLFQDIYQLKRALHEYRIDGAER